MKGQYIIVLVKLLKNNFNNSCLVDPSSRAGCYGGAINSVSNKNNVLLACNTSFINNFISVYNNYGVSSGGALCLASHDKFIDCSFINNSVLSHIYNKSCNGGAIWSNSLTVQGCIFDDNTAFNGSEIYYYQTSVNYLNIIECTFKETNGRNSIINSLFYLEIGSPSSKLSEFVDNEFFITKTNDVFVFDGIDTKLLK